MVLHIVSQHIVVEVRIVLDMAGAVRQPIDVPSLERYLNLNVPDIKTPLDVKQVYRMALFDLIRLVTHNLHATVWLWSIQPYLSTHHRRRQQICPAQEAPGQATLQDRAQSRARVQDHPCPRKHRRARPQSLLSLRG